MLDSVAGEIERQRLRSPLVLASDIHLRDMNDNRGQMLLDVIARVDAEAVEYFILNGDIFDFCLGDSPHFHKKFRSLGEALTRLAQAGTRVLLVEGNHEFHMQAMVESGCWEGVEIISAIDTVITLKSGERFKIAHGDLIKDDPYYRLFRRFVKGAFARWCARFIPGSWLDAYALRHAKVSRATDIYRKLDHEKLLAAANRWLQEGDYRAGIFGHFHVPYGELRATGLGQILSVDSWDKPNLLVFEQGTFFRIYLLIPGKSYRMHKVEALFS